MLLLPLEYWRFDSQDMCDIALFIHHYAGQLQVLHLSLSYAPSTVVLWEACCECKQLRRLELEYHGASFGERRGEQAPLFPPLSTRSTLPYPSLPLLHSLKIDFHSQDLLLSVLAACPAMESLTILDKCYQPLQVTSDVLTAAVQIASRRLSVTNQHVAACSADCAA